MGRGIEYQVVINHEEQYSVWPLAERLPKGYRALEKGPGDECLRRLEDLLAMRSDPRE